MISEQLQTALKYAEKVHEGQYRKGSKIPYFTHVYRVATEVKMMGGNEIQVIAALLHDTLEDQPGRANVANLQRLFGPEVIRIVLRATKPLKIVDYGERYNAYLDQLKGALPDEQLVILVDKLDNLIDTLGDVLMRGSETMKKFKNGRATMVRFHMYADIFDQWESQTLAQEIDRYKDKLGKLEELLLYE